MRSCIRSDIGGLCPFLDTNLQIHVTINNRMMTGSSGKCLLPGILTTNQSEEYTAVHIQNTLQEQTLKEAYNVYKPYEKKEMSVNKLVCSVTMCVLTAIAVLFSLIIVAPIIRAERNV